MEGTYERASEIFAAQYSTNLTQLSTNFIFIFLQNGGANFTHIVGRAYTGWFLIINILLTIVKIAKWYKTFLFSLISSMLHAPNYGSHPISRIPCITNTYYLRY